MTRDRGDRPPRHAVCRSQCSSIARDFPVFNTGGVDGWGRGRAVRSIDHESQTHDSGLLFFLAMSGQAWWRISCDLRDAFSHDAHMHRRVPRETRTEAPAGAGRRCPRSRSAFTSRTDGHRFRGALPDSVREGTRMRSFSHPAVFNWNNLLLYRRRDSRRPRPKRCSARRLRT